jgi:hypothetical protein
MDRQNLFEAPVLMYPLIVGLMPCDPELPVVAQPANTIVATIKIKPRKTPFLTSFFMAILQLL